MINPNTQSSSCIVAQSTPFISCDLFPIIEKIMMKIDKAIVTVECTSMLFCPIILCCIIVAYHFCFQLLMVKFDKSTCVMMQLVCTCIM